MKKVFIASEIIFIGVSSLSQSKEAGTRREAVKQYINSKNLIPEIPQNKNAAGIKNLVKQYSSAIEKLDITGTEKCFTSDFNFYESGAGEANYTHYREPYLTLALRVKGLNPLYDFFLNLTISEKNFKQALVLVIYSKQKKNGAFIIFIKNYNI